MAQPGTMTSQELLHYAIHSVEHLLELREKMLEHGCEKVGGMGGWKVDGNGQWMWAGGC